MAEQEKVWWSLSLWLSCVRAPSMRMCVRWSER